MRSTCGIRHLTTTAIIVTMVLAAIDLFAPAIHAATPKWTEWEQANSVAKKGQWLVIRQPEEGFCYIKQGYDGRSDKLDLSMKLDGVPYLTTPFFHGIQGDVSYRVDNGPMRIVPESKVSGSVIKLSPGVVSELRRGSMLTVRVKPAGMPTLQQTFDLRGFTAASGLLGSTACQQKVPDRYQY